MEFTTHIRVPFTVEALLITDDNLDEVAKLVGTVHTDDQGKRHIEAHKIPTISVVTPGYYLTKMGPKIRCYSPHIFGDQFVEETDAVSYHLAFIEEARNAALVGKPEAEPIVEDIPEAVIMNVFEQATEA